MCILLSTTEHPDYPLILLSNRDEYFARPTQLATLRRMKDGGNVLSPLDLGRPEHGTWIGVTSTGKIAVLVNYREVGLFVSEVSRGILPLEYLTSDLTDDEQWYNTLEEKLSKATIAGTPAKLDQIGGFSLVYGKVEVDAATGRLKPLNIMSNRGDRGKVHSFADCATDLHEEIAKRSVFGLSNSLYYHPWKKVELGTSKLRTLVADAVEEDYSLDRLVESSFELLLTDTYDPEVRNLGEGASLEKLKELQNSIFIPPLEYESSTVASDKLFSPPPFGQYYGTRTQTVIMYHKSGTLHYFERDLHPDDQKAMKIRRQHYKFDLHSS